VRGDLIEETRPVRGSPSGWGAARSVKSHNCVVPSLLAVARVFPSGENTSDNTI